MPGYKKPCIYCDKLVPSDANVCPMCGKKNPLSLRCPKCRSPVKRGWKCCSSCGLTLEVRCLKCSRVTFFGDYCDHCEGELTVICQNPKCRVEQPPLENHCKKCGKPL